MKLASDKLTETIKFLTVKIPKMEGQWPWPNTYFQAWIHYSFTKHHSQNWKCCLSKKRIYLLGGFISGCTGICIPFRLVSWNAKKCYNRVKDYISYSQTRCSLASNIAILQCNVAILMCKLLGPNYNRFEKWLPKSYNVLKIYLQIIFVKSVYLIYKVHVGKSNNWKLM